MAGFNLAHDLNGLKLRCERSQLKDAFGVVQTLQGVLSGHYSGGRL